MCVLCNKYIWLPMWNGSEDGLDFFFRFSLKEWHVFYTSELQSRPSLQLLFCNNARTSSVCAAPSRSSQQNNVESQLISKNRVEPGRKVKTLNKSVWESWLAGSAANCIVLDKLHALTNPDLWSLEWYPRVHINKYIQSLWEILSLSVGQLLPLKSPGQPGNFDSWK